MTGFGSSCGACKFLRRKCTSDCVFAPYFSYDQASTHFAAVHKIYGASNVSKLLSHLPIQNRSDAAVTISYEALARMQDPIYGCVAHIYALQHQVSHAVTPQFALSHHNLWTWIPCSWISMHLCQMKTGRLRFDSSFLHLTVIMKSLCKYVEKW